MKKCIILSGCSCSGKTTLFNKIKSLYECSSVSECASTIIKRYQENKILLPWEKDNSGKDFLKFQTQIFTEQLKQVSKIDLTKDLILLDRTFEDMMGYVSLYLEDESELSEYRLTKTYFKYFRGIEDVKYYVFFLNPIEFTNNGIRNTHLDTDNVRKQEYNYIKASYDKGFFENEIYIEKNQMSVDDRLKLIQKICEI